MELTTVVIPATAGKSQSEGASSWSATAGQRFKIEVQGGVDIANILVPAGKRFENGKVTVTFDMVDA